MFCKISILTALFLTSLLFSCSQNDQNANTDSENTVSVNNQASLQNTNSDTSNFNNSEPSPTQNNSDNSNSNNQNNFQSEKFQNIKPAHAEVLAEWLKTKPNLQIAKISEFPAEQLKRFRNWKKDANAHPYYTDGDFDKDGKPEFAVLLNNEKTGESRSLAVFELDSEEPVFYKDKMFTHFILSFDKEKKSLYISSFESDDGVILTQKGGKYILESMLPEDK